MCCLHTECVFAQLELVQQGAHGEAILFHLGVSYNKVIIAGQVYILSNLTMHSLLLEDKKHLLVPLWVNCLIATADEYSKKC